MYGVSTDTVESHSKFRASLSLPFPLLADVDGKISTAYDSVSVHGGKNYSARKIVVIDKAGVVVYRDEAYQVGDADDFNAVVAAVANL